MEAILKHDSKMREKNILKVLASSHAIEILEELKRSPLRFSDLDHVCPSRKTRYLRLRDLEKQGLIIVVPKLEGRRSYTYYETTRKGSRAVELVKRLLSINQTTQTKFLKQ